MLWKLAITNKMYIIIYDFNYSCICIQIQICGCENRGICNADGVVDESANPLILDCTCPEGTVTSLYQLCFIIIYYSD